ncbi:hypothetical protein COW09_00985 [bacterium (Candidatus Moisslbacteria) CG12_big_fil_rev_8_21_14_0_65_36_11]|nr:hypothetical protein [Candidatus Kuenenbacteria bacterium]OIP76234.1 MAG: hypothetical protein AUK09_02505 [Parcubacteria group bacterium CG2_30_36_38]PIV46239.1 MAG: hypothetical protein COS23_00215 [bacterium (Candidatus Moisslbacteria) CG02_land_8_20_14_3_00_36_53]PIW67933.1 MAG: hypothetical protein COW09_00985 [bacterium (Candidatus Moisslbacteria) CG12_big_fil_rev_8_21_14_0_65_36_11]PIZ90235.1 MAG: hypothetical protein COX87_01585 [bacterium (Candidatus Moisslbacteria) CG_4_10_14_0_2_u
MTKEIGKKQLMRNLQKVGLGEGRIQIKFSKRKDSGLLWLKDRNGYEPNLFLLWNDRTNSHSYLSEVGHFKHIENVRYFSRPQVKNGQVKYRITDSAGINIFYRRQISSLKKITLN